MEVQPHTNNIVFGYQKNGMEIEGAGSSGTISGNTVTGAGPITFNSQNGIQIRRGATGTIGGPLPSDANTVTGNAYILPSSCNPSGGNSTIGSCYSAIGISVTYPGNGVIIQGNTVNHNTANIYTYEATGVQILNNIVSDSAVSLTSAGITADSDNVATASAGITGVTISGNTIKNNLSGGSHQGDGILLWGMKGAVVSNNTVEGSGYDGILVGASGNISITGNTFSGNGSLVTDPNAAAIDFGGVYHTFPFMGLQPNTLGGFTVHNNSFTGNKNGIWNYDSGSVNATNNWWGSVTPVFASLVSVNVDHTTWAINPGATILNTSLDTGTGTIDATSGNIDFNSPSTGQAELPSDITNITLSNTTSIDLSNAVQTQPPVDVTVGGNIVSLTQTVVLQSGTNDEPIVLTNTDLSNVSVSIPDTTTIKGPAAWDGTIEPPKAETPSGNAPAGFSVGDTVITIGSPDGTLVFDKPVIIILEGVTGPVGYRPAGSDQWTLINSTCGGEYANPLAPLSGSECSISNGTDTKISTFHFTSFGKLVGSLITGGGGGGGGGGSFTPTPTPTPAVTPTPSPVAVAPTTPAPVGQVLGAITFGNGTLVKTADSGTVYMVVNGELRPFNTPAIFNARALKFSNIQIITADQLAATTVGKPVGYPDGTLALDTSNNRTVYVIGNNGTKRGFVSAAVFTALGYKFNQAVRANLADYPVGDPITSVTVAHPDGTLVISGKTIWWVNNGQKHGFTSMAVLNSYGWTMSKVLKASDADTALPEASVVEPNQ